MKNKILKESGVIILAVLLALPLLYLSTLDNPKNHQINHTKTSHIKSENSK